MKSFKKPNSKVLVGFLLYLTIFSSIALTLGTSYKQTLEDRELTVSPGKRGRYYLRYQNFFDTEMTVRVTSDVPLYFLEVNAVQWNESNQAAYNTEENYLTGEGRAYTLVRKEGLVFDETWTVTTNDIRYIILQNEEDSIATVNLFVMKNDLSTIARFFGIGSAILLAGFFSWILISKKKLSGQVTEE